MTTLAVPSGPISSLLLGAAGGALVGGRPRRTAPGLIAAITGLALVGVAAHRPIVEALRRAGNRRRTGSLHMSLVVPQSVDVVFRFCSNFENFPRFITALRGVEDFGDGRSHWSGWAPGGHAIEWDTVTSKFVTNRVIAWQSKPSSPIRSSGTLRFVPEKDGGTCVRIALDFSVPVDGLVDAVAALAIPTRYSELESDIRRLPEQIELCANAPQPAVPALPAL
jgi:uncharacterized membrane protein